MKPAPPVTMMFFTSDLTENLVVPMRSGASRQTSASSDLTSSPFAPVPSKAYQLRFSNCQKSPSLPLTVIVKTLTPWCHKVEPSYIEASVLSVISSNEGLVDSVCHGHCMCSLPAAI